MYQHFFLNLTVLHSHGAIFFLDLEWNHFLFNTIYCICLWAVIISGRWYRKENRDIFPFFSYALFAGVTVETWHVIEHTVRIYQHVQSGCEPCMGIIGPYTDVIYLHGAYNLLSLVLPFVAYIIGKYHLRLWHLI